VDSLGLRLVGNERIREWTLLRTVQEGALGDLD
jgi:hypothetical protein